MNRVFPMSSSRNPWWSLFLLAVIGILAPAEGAALQGEEVPAFPVNPDLTDYLMWSERNNPAVAGAEGRAAALRGNAKVAGSLPDFRVGWGEMIVPVETRVGPQQRIFSLSQNIPWFGTLGLKEAVAASRADAAAENSRVQRLAVHHAVRAAWYELAFLQGKIRILDANLLLAREAETVARSVYETGSGSFADVLTAGIDREKLSAELVGLTDGLRPASVRLNVVAGLAADLPVPEISSLSPNHLDSQLPDSKALWGFLQENNPQLAVLERELESRRRSVELAGKSGYPDLTFGIDYIMTGEAVLGGTPGSGKDPVIARVAVSIPLWGGKASGEKEASAGWLRAASADYSDARLQIQTRLETAVYSWRESGRNLELYGKTLLDAAHQALDVTTARYRSGQSSYGDLVSARRTLLGLELAHLRARTDRALALNDLATLVGVAPEQLMTGGSS